MFLWVSENKSHASDIDKVIPTFVSLFLLSPLLFSKIGIFSSFSGDSGQNNCNCNNYIQLILLVQRVCDKHVGIFWFNHGTFRQNLWQNLPYCCNDKHNDKIISWCNTENIYQKSNANTLLYPSSCWWTQVSRKTAPSYCTTNALMGIKTFTVNRK